ncbi:MAG: hypothetical protein U9Q39_04295, partial [Pseudomonadota bacterium]|nr:hypothetical protein [Pseudomonadota bacterium]
ALPTGNYCIDLEEYGDYHFMSAAGVVLPDTSICFTVGSSSQADLIHTYYIPYFTSGGVYNYWSGLGVSNNNELSPATIQITTFNSNGTILATSPRETIAANGQFSNVLAAGQTATGWARIDSSEELSGLSFMGFSFMGSSIMADVPFVSELSTALMIPHMAQDNSWDTHALVCNPNNTPAVITLTFISPTGQAHISAPQPLGAYCSATYPLSTIFANYLPLPRGKVKLTVTQGDGICAFALYKNQKTGGHCFAGISADPLLPSGPIHPF